MTKANTYHFILIEHLFSQHFTTQNHRASYPIMQPISTGIKSAFSRDLHVRIPLHYKSRQTSGDTKESFKRLTKRRRYSIT